MTDDKLKQMIREILTPVLDTLCDMTYSIHSVILKRMDGMPEEQIDKFMSDIIKANGNALISSIKASIPKDLDKQIKEAMDDRK